MVDVARRAFGAIPNDLVPSEAAAADVVVPVTSRRGAGYASEENRMEVASRRVPGQTRRPLASSLPGPM
jgi:hypothetical protein